MMSLNGHEPDNHDLDAAVVEEVGEFLRRLPAPQARPEAKARLLSALVAEAPPARLAAPSRLRWGWLILRTQLRVVHHLTWAASLLVMALGFVVTLALYRPTITGSELPFALVAPLVAAFGVAFLYGVDADPLLELQLSTPISPRLILLARLTLVFGFNLALGLTCSAVFALMQTQLSFSGIIMAWLAPMAFLSALAFVIGILFFDAMLSSLVSILLWCAIVWRHFNDLGVSSLARYVPPLLAPEFRPALLALAVGLLVVGLWVAGTENRREFSTER
jgi:hypothetical protein